MIQSCKVFVILLYQHGGISCERCMFLNNFRGWRNLDRILIFADMHNWDISMGNARVIFRLKCFEIAITARKIQDIFCLNFINTHCVLGLILIKSNIGYISKNYLTTYEPYFISFQKIQKIRKLYSTDPDSGSGIRKIWDQFFLKYIVANIYPELNFF